MKIKMNPDKKHAAQIRQALTENDGYCPCSLIKNEDTKCMCKEFREMIKKHKSGACHCGLYVYEDSEQCL